MNVNAYMYVHIHHIRDWSVVSSVSISFPHLDPAFLLPIHNGRIGKALPDWMQTVAEQQVLNSCEHIQGIDFRPL